MDEAYHSIIIIVAVVAVFVIIIIIIIVIIIIIIIIIIVIIIYRNISFSLFCFYRCTFYCHVSVDEAGE